MSVEMVAIGDIKLKSKGRFYREVGDVSDLMESMGGPNGLLQPILIDEDNYLVFGHRRLAAAKKLGWEKIAVNRFNTFSMDALSAIRDENNSRRDFTISEKVALGRIIEEAESKRRKAERKEKPADDHQTLAAEAPVRDVAAKQVGLSPQTYERAKEVVAAAEANERHAPLVAEMDETGKVASAWKRIHKPKRKPGQPLFDWKEFDRHIGRLTGDIDECAKAHKCKEGPFHKSAIEALEKFIKAIDRWKVDASKVEAA